MGWLISMSVRPISSTVMSEYKYSGRNLFGEGIPPVLKNELPLQPPSKTIFPCRVYDAEGNLKYEITKEEIIDKEVYSLLRKVKQLEKGKHG